MSFQTLIGNFALILFVLLVITGVIWLLDIFVLARRHRIAADRALEVFDAQSPANQSARAILEANILRQPTWVEYSGSFFPVIALVFILRSFLFEPFKIPSGSMLPTLFVGDLILVNKFTYGIRLPIVGTKLVQLGSPQRGDVMVFKYPRDPSKDYIKRVVGTPGDIVSYKDKHLTINGESLTYGKLNDFLHEGKDLNYASQFEENLNGIKHKVLNDESRSTNVPLFSTADFPFSEKCRNTEDGFECVVPDGHYFMMGDNRDNSADSRYWGFVPDRNILGKAIYVWMNVRDLSRVGTKIH